MLISCPSCPKMYRVPASAIPPEGREVSCSACGTVWFERGVDAEVVSVGGGAFTAAPYRAPIHQEKSHTKISTTPAQPASQDEEKTQVGSNVVALWAPDADAPGWETPSEQAANEKKSRKADFADTAPPEVKPEIAQQPDVPVTDTAKAVEDVATLFAAEEKATKLDVQLPSFADIKASFSQWRGRQQSRSLNQGMDAALKFRSLIRARERNRLTPARRFGWSLWILMLAALAVVISDRQLMEKTWPDSAKAYAAVLGVPENPESLELKNVTTRYAQSIEGPVLEIRGTVVNAGTVPALPLLELSVDGYILTDYEAVSISEVTVPARGERPFVVRAMVPDGTKRADIRVLAEQEKLVPEMQGFTLQRTGSGWGGATLPPLPLEAIKTAH